MCEQEIKHAEEHYDREIQLSTSTVTVCISSSCKEDSLKKIKKMAEDLIDKYSNNKSVD